MGKDVIIALDMSHGEEAYRFLDRFHGETPYVKVGMELFYAEGPAIVREIKRRGHALFLDLKLHDIPNTVRKAAAVLAGLGVDMTNVHAAGGGEMMGGAREELGAGPGKRPLLIAVTQLTSTSQERMRDELLIPLPIEEVVARYAQNAQRAGLGRRGLFAPGSAACEGSLRDKLYYGNARGALRRRGRGGPGADRHAGQSQGHRFRLHRGGAAHHRGRGPGGRVPALPGRVRGMTLTVQV